MKHIMAVYDVDPFYAARFADVVNQKEKIPFEVVAFSSLEKLRAFAGGNPIELLLISSSVSREEAEEIHAGKVVVLEDGETVSPDEKKALSDGETGAAAKEYPGVYKYQSSDSIIREVMACYCEREEAAPRVLAKSASKIYGVYSPVGRCMKTSFSITLGKVLSQEGRALYLNLEEFSGLSALTGTEYRTDLSDLLYYFAGGNYNLLRLNSVVHTMDGLDYVPPVRYPEDLEQAGEEQLAGLIKAIAQEGAYENLIIDVGVCRRMLPAVLDLCHVIYMPVLEDSVSRAKLEEFERYLEQTGNGELRNRIKRLTLPRSAYIGRRENYLEQLLWSELGDYARQLLRGQPGVRRQ